MPCVPSAIVFESRQLQQQKFTPPEVVATAVAEAANGAVGAAAVQVRGFVVKAQKVVDASWNIEVQQQEEQYQ